jgi:hypothetical protein
MADWETSADLSYAARLNARRCETRYTPIDWLKLASAGALFLAAIVFAVLAPIPETGPIEPHNLCRTVGC